MTVLKATSHRIFTQPWFYISLLLCLNSILSWYGCCKIEVKTSYSQPSKDFEKSVMYDGGILRVSVVVSHCRGSLHWLRGFISDVSVRNITVVSKCGVTPELEHLPNGTQLLQLPNVGRCDHTYAYWMVEKVQSHEKDEIIVFLKDNLNSHKRPDRPRDMQEMINMAVINGFACYLRANGGQSYFHDTTTLSYFNLASYDSYTRNKKGKLVPKQDEAVHSKKDFKSQFKNMGAWLEEMGISLPKPYTPVCYGGEFAVRKSRILAVPMIVRQNLKRSLERGDSIEESHFMERTWAGLLSEPIGPAENELLANKTRGINGPETGVYGALLLNSPDLPDLYRLFYH